MNNITFVNDGGSTYKASVCVTLVIGINLPKIIMCEEAIGSIYAETEQEFWKRFEDIKNALEERLPRAVEDNSKKTKEEGSVNKLEIVTMGEVTVPSYPERKGITAEQAVDYCLKVLSPPTEENDDDWL